MKNLHILPTNQSSEYFINKVGVLSQSYSLKRGGAVHFYITSNEEIKDKCYVLSSTSIGALYLDGVINTASMLAEGEWKKIILTTDQDLIKDGVQAINDEFLEWFVKNPSCDEVEIKEHWAFYPLGLGKKLIAYEIIIPKEELTNPNNQEVMFHQERQEHFYEDFVDGKLVTVWLGKNYIPKEEHLIDMENHENSLWEEPKQETLEEVDELIKNKI